MSSEIIEVVRPHLASLGITDYGVCAIKEISKYLGEIHVISKSVDVEIRKLDRYIYINKNWEYKVNRFLVVPSDADINEYRDSFYELLNSNCEIAVKVYTEGRGGGYYWSETNSYNPNKYVYSGNDNFGQLVSSAKIADDLSDTGVDININLIFYGLPGTGKSRLARDLAIALRKDLHIINSRNTVTVPPDSVLLIEEMDKILMPNGEFINPNDDSIDMLLQFLDGAIRPRKSIIIITCNDMSKLASNKVLFRPGRFTKVIEFGYVTESQLKALCEPLYPFDDHMKLWNIIKDANATIAELSTIANNYVIYGKLFSELLTNVIAELKKLRSMSTKLKNTLYY